MRRILIGCVAGAMAVVTSVQAVEWTLDGNGVWTDDGNWSGTHPNGVGAVADFSTIDLIANRTVTLDALISVGSMTFGDISGTQQYNFQTNAAGAGLIYDNGGSPAVIHMKTGGAMSWSGVPITLNSDLVITNSGGGQVQAQSHSSFGGTDIGGTGGITVESGFLGLNGANSLTYTGQTTINNDGTIMFYSTHPPGNITVNDNGLYRGYYIYSMTRNLGSGSGSLRFTGGPGTTSGFGWNNNMTVKFNNDAGTVVQWGGGDFDMETLLLENTGGTLKVLTFQNILDLNGGDRTIQVTTTTNVTTQYAKMSGEIRDVAEGGSLTKTGNGRLQLTAANTYAGDTTVSEGILELTAANTGNDESTITIAESGATFTLNFTGNETVKLLQIGTSWYYAGEYGHTDSGADNGGRDVGALDAYFGAGSGKLIVTGGPSGTQLIIR